MISSITRRRSLAPPLLLVVLVLQQISAMLVPEYDAAVTVSVESTLPSPSLEALSADLFLHEIAPRLDLRSCVKLAAVSVQLQKVATAALDRRIAAMIDSLFVREPASPSLLHTLQTLADLALTLRKRFAPVLDRLTVAQFCLLFDRLSALVPTLALNDDDGVGEVDLADVLALVQTVLPQAHATFARLNRCWSSHVGGTAPGRYQLPLWPQRLLQLRDKLGRHVPHKWMNQWPSEDDLLQLWAGDPDRALGQAATHAALLKVELRLHLTNVLYHVRLSTAELDAVLPFLWAFGSESKPAFWTFFHDVRRLAQSDSATSLDEFWTLPPVAGHFRALSPVTFVDQIDRVEHLRTLIDVRFPFLDVMLFSQPLMERFLRRTCTSRNFALLDFVLHPPMPYAAQLQERIPLTALLQQEPALIHRLLSWAQLGRVRGRYGAVVATIRAAAVPSLWLQTTTRIAVGCRLTAIVHGQLLANVLGRVIPHYQLPRGPIRAVLADDHDGGVRRRPPVDLDGAVRRALAGANGVVPNPNPSNHSSTILHEVVRHRRAILMAALLGAGDEVADVGARDRHGLLAFDYIADWVQYGPGADGGGPSAVAWAEALIRHVERLCSRFGGALPSEFPFDIDHPDNVDIVTAATVSQEPSTITASPRRPRSKMHRWFRACFRAQ